MQSAAGLLIEIIHQQILYTCRDKLVDDAAKANWSFRNNLVKNKTLNPDPERKSKQNREILTFSGEMRVPLRGQLKRA